MERLFPRYNTAEAAFAANLTSQQKRELIMLLRIALGSASGESAAPS